MNLMLALSLFNTLAIGMIPAYLILKLEKADLQEQGAIQMAITSDSVRRILKGPENGNVLRSANG